MVSDSSPKGLTKCSAVGCVTFEVSYVERVPLCTVHRGALAVALRGEDENGPPVGAVVIYTVWAEEEVHIAWCTDPAAVLAALRTRYAGMRLLVAEPGGAPEYRAACKALKGSALGEDRFRGDADTVAHIKAVRERYPDWRTLVNEAAWHRARRRKWTDVASAYTAEGSPVEAPVRKRPK